MSDEIRTRAARSTERAIRYALLAVFAVGVRRRDPGAVANALAALAGTAFPAWVERDFDVDVRPWQRAYVGTAMLAHAVGMLGPYDETWWWDHVTHTLSATVLGGTVFAAARRRGWRPTLPVLGATLGAGLLWEGFEYLVHAGAKRLGLEPVLVPYGRDDTLWDVVFDAVGALLVLVLGDSLLRNLVRDEGPTRNGGDAPRR